MALDGAHQLLVYSYINLRCGNVNNVNKNLKGLSVPVKEAVRIVKTEKTRYMFVSLEQHSG
jgi:hypothetical protein